MKAFIIRVLKKLLKLLGYKIPIKTVFPEYKALKNINIDLTRNQKKVLIAYIDDIFYDDFLSKPLYPNKAETSAIVKIFIDLDFIVDVIWPLAQDSYIDSQKYDVIFGLGESYLRACKNNPQAIKILYLTENNPLTVTEKFKERVDYYFQRRGSLQTGIVRNNFYDESAFTCSDYGILLTNEYNSKRSIPYFKKSFLINPSCLINKQFIYKEIDFNSTKRDFVWFGSSGAIHKGLDILVDVFKILPDYRLHIFGLNKQEEDLLDINNNEKNISIHAPVYVYSDEFLKEVVEKCAFCILPSCSEGQSTSAITCMAHGILPIVTRDCGLNIPDEYIFILESYKVEYIRDFILYVSHIGDLDLEEKRKKMYEYTRTNFNLNVFSETFKKSITNILNESI